MSGDRGKRSVLEDVRLMGGWALPVANNAWQGDSRDAYAERTAGSWLSTSSATWVNCTVG